MDQLIFASLSHSHYGHEVGMLKASAVEVLHTVISVLVPRTIIQDSLPFAFECLTLLALDYSPSDRPDCHKNSLRFTKIKFQEKK